eukprot:5425284-Prymnesium_polylepis.1
MPPGVGAHGRARGEREGGNLRRSVFANPSLPPGAVSRYALARPRVACSLCFAPTAPQRSRARPTSTLGYATATRACAAARLGGTAPSTTPTATRRARVRRGGCAAGRTGRRCTGSRGPTACCWAR